MSGLPATGKSAIATGLGRSFGAPVLSVDPIEDALLRSGIAQDQPTGLAAYVVAATVAEASLALGQAVVIDAVNGVVEAKDWWRDLADRFGVPLAVIETVCSDPEVHRQRLESRSRQLAAFPSRPGTPSSAFARNGWTGPRSGSSSTPSGHSPRTWHARSTGSAAPGTTKRPKEPRVRSLQLQCKHRSRRFRSRGPFGQDLQYGPGAVVA